MECLVAHFTLQLAEPILVEDRRGTKRAFKVVHDGYEAEIAWNDEDVHERIWKRNARRPGYGISKLKISVSHHRTAPYPKDNEQKTHPWGGLQGYADIATLIMNRLIRYFRFTLGHPLLEAVRAQELRTSNPQWTDENGTPLDVRIMAVEAKGFAGLRHSPGFGIKPFTPEQFHEFEKALQVDTSYELYEELMVDARDALMQGNLRRGVLEMAMACEVVTKEFCSKKNITVKHETVPMILNTVLKKAIGTGFADSPNKEHWHNIEYLFQCRNNAAHGKNLGYNDKHGAPQNVDYKTFQDWWHSLETLIEWIRSRD
jgi:hypothetical protein